MVRHTELPIERLLRLDQPQWTALGVAEDVTNQFYSGAHCCIAAIASSTLHTILSSECNASTHWGTVVPSHMPLIWIWKPCHPALPVQPAQPKPINTHLSNIDGSSTVCFSKTPAFHGCTTHLSFIESHALPQLQLHSLR